MHVLHSPTLKQISSSKFDRGKIYNSSHNIKSSSVHPNFFCKHCAHLQSEIHHSNACMPNLVPPICMQTFKFFFQNMMLTS